MFLDCAIQKTAPIAFTVSLEGISTPVGQHEQTLLISALQLGSFLIRYWPCVWPWVKLIGSCSFHKRDVSYPRSDFWELLQRLPVSLPTLLEVLFHLPGLREQFLPASACLGEVMNHAGRQRQGSGVCVLGALPCSRSPVLVSFTREDEQASGVVRAPWTRTCGIFATMEFLVPPSSSPWTPYRVQYQEINVEWFALEKC